MKPRYVIQGPILKDGVELYAVAEAGYKSPEWAYVYDLPAAQAAACEANGEDWE